MKRASVGQAELLLLSGSVGVVLLGVVVAEMALRWINPHRLDRREAGQQVYSEWYGWENRRGFEGPLHDVLTTVDARGRRSPGRITRESEPRPRVVMLGDSITFGSAVRDEETFCALMTPRYDVVNLGVEGYGTDQELLKLEREGLANHPDVVVLNFTVANDIWNVRSRFDDVTRLPKPYFTLVGGAPVLHREHLRRSPLGRVEQWISDYSELYDLVRPLLPERRALAEAPALGPKEGLRLTVALISRMEVDTAAAGARFVVVLHPDQATFEQRSSVADSLTQQLESVGVTAITSLAGTYRGSGLAYDRIARDDSGHLTPLGHRMAAEEIERVLAR
jgi:GDSL-like Lipase/Acylhydrolase family